MCILFPLIVRTAIWLAVVSMRAAVCCGKALNDPEIARLELQQQPPNTHKGKHML